MHHPASAIAPEALVDRWTCSRRLPKQVPRTLHRVQCHTWDHHQAKAVDHRQARRCQWAAVVVQCSAASAWGERAVSLAESAGRMRQARVALVDWVLVARHWLMGHLLTQGQVSLPGLEGVGLGRWMPAVRHHHSRSTSPIRLRCISDLSSHRRHSVLVDLALRHRSSRRQVMVHLACRPGMRLACRMRLPASLVLGMPEGPHLRRRHRRHPRASARSARSGDRRLALLRLEVR